MEYKPEFAPKFVSKFVPEFVGERKTLLVEFQSLCEVDFTTTSPLDEGMFICSVLQRVNFQGLYMPHMLFINCVIVDCNFMNTSLTSTEFANCVIVNSCFDGAKLNYAISRNTRIDCCSFKGTYMKDSVGFPVQKGGYINDDARNISELNS